MKGEDYHALRIRNIVIATNLRHNGASIKDIAKDLGISKTTVRKLLSHASEFIELRYNIPEDDELEKSIIEKYKLVDARVLETGNENTAIPIIAQAGAGYFVDNIQNGNRVAISCGETLLSVIQALPYSPSLEIKISQLSIEADPETVHQAPATLAGLLRAKTSPQSKVFGMQLPPPRIVGSCKEFRRQLAESELLKRLRNDALESDIVLLGVGIPIKHRKDPPQSFIRMAEEATGREFSYFVDKFSLIGEINNQVYNGQGKDFTSKIPDFRDYVINVLSLAEIQKLAADRSKKVIALATGKKKLVAIKAALDVGFANVLITGREDAKSLLD